MRLARETLSNLMQSERNGFAHGQYDEARATADLVDPGAPGQRGRLVRWREGLVVPLEPLVRRAAHDDRFDLYWMDHLPRPGLCHLSAVIGVAELKVPYESLRIPAVFRGLMER